MIMPNGNVFQPNLNQIVNRRGPLAFVPELPSAQALAQTQFAREKPIQEQLLAALSQREKPTAIRERLAEEAGLPQQMAMVRGLRGQVLDVENLLAQLPEDIGRRTARSLVTEAQRRALEAREARPLREELTQVGRALTAGEAGLSDIERGVSERVRLASEEQEQALRPFTTQLEFLSDQAAREATGFTKDQEVQLTLLRDALSRGERLSEREFERITRLEEQERGFQQEKELAQLRAGIEEGAAERGLRLRAGLEEGAAERQLRLKAGLSEEEAQRGFGRTQEELRLRAQLEEEAAGRAGEREMRLLQEEIAAGRFARTPAEGRGGRAPTSAEIKAQQTQANQEFLKRAANQLSTALGLVQQSASSVQRAGRMRGLPLIINRLIQERPDLGENIMDLAGQMGVDLEMMRLTQTLF